MGLSTRILPLAFAAGTAVLASNAASWAQCSGVLNSECMNTNNPEYNSYRCSQQRACDEKSSSTPSRPTFGAVAYSYATGSFGWQFDDSAEGAAQGALGQCRRVLRQSSAKADDCEVNGTIFRLPGCASIGQSDNGAYFITAATSAAEANEKALEGCRKNRGVDCKVPDGMPRCRN
jgi:hypothetical protein